MRACYDVPMRMYPDDPTRVTTVRWFFVDPATPALELPNSFSTRTWDLRDLWIPSPIGEDKPRTYSKGAPPEPQTPGPVPCGTPDQWLNGCALSAPELVEWPTTTIPRCCPRPPNLPNAGTGFGTDFALTNCVPCPAIRRVLYASFTVTVGTCPALDGLVVPVLIDGQACGDSHGWVPLGNSLPFDVNGINMKLTVYCRQIGVNDYCLQTLGKAADCSADLNLASCQAVITCEPLTLGPPESSLGIFFGCPLSEFTVGLSS